MGRYPCERIFLLCRDLIVVLFRAIGFGDFTSFIESISYLVHSLYCCIAGPLNDTRLIFPRCSYLSLMEAHSFRFFFGLNLLGQRLKTYTRLLASFIKLVPCPFSLLLLCATTAAKLCRDHFAVRITRAGHLSDRHYKRHWAVSAPNQQYAFGFRN